MQSPLKLVELVDEKKVFLDGVSFSYERFF
jgi:hypothetical protein